MKYSHKRYSVDLSDIDFTSADTQKEINDKKEMVSKLTKEIHDYQEKWILSKIKFLLDNYYNSIFEKALQENNKELTKKIVEENLIKIYNEPPRNTPTYSIHKFVIHKDEKFMGSLETIFYNEFDLNDAKPRIEFREF